MKQGKRKRGRLTLLAALTYFHCMLFVSISHAVVMPVYERLQPITVNAPTAVALDENGNIYVAESTNKHVSIYGISGDLRGILSGFKSPISVAVDGSGRIYVGDKTDGCVAVYDSNLNLLFKLGIGDGEFIHPNDIAVDSSGKIYVADVGMALIKRYNPDGSYNGSLGGPGSGTVPTPDGKFNKPKSIEITAAGEIIVLDLALTYDSYGTLISGARIQQLNLDGSFKSSLTKYGMNMVSGEMFVPQHLAVDGEGRIYVTDSFHNVVLVYGDDGDDTNGSNDVYLGAVFDLDEPQRTPLGITIGKNSKLYIASLRADRVDVFGIESYTNMAVTPQSLDYSHPCVNPLPQSIHITNNGTANLNWTAGANENWITLSATSGSTPVSGTTSFSMGVNRSGLAAGSYSGTVSVRAESGDTAIVNVELTVPPAFIADAGTGYQGMQGLPVWLDGSHSTGCIVKYEWDIGNDGTYEYSSTSPKKSHTFVSNGSYDITLRVTDVTGSEKYANATALIYDNSVPVASFMGSPVYGTAPLTVNFINNSTGDEQPLTYEWDFNCDTAVDSSDENPSYTYEAGIYSVCLRVRDSGGSEAVSIRTNYIRVNAGCESEDPVVKIDDACYDTLQDAYDYAGDGAIIQTRDVTLTQNLNADRNISVSLEGGYNSGYTGKNGKTILNGSITMSNGTLTIGDFISQ